MIKFSLLVATVATVSLGTALADEGDINSDKAVISAGAELYADNCAVCHGADLEGAEDWQGYNEDGTLKPPPHDASGHTWHHSDTLLFDYVKLGGTAAMAKVALEEFNSGMPPFGDTLTDEEIWNILAFIKSSWPEDIQQTQREISEEERALNEAKNK